MTLNDLIPALGRPKPRKANRAETKLRKVEGQLAAVRQDNVKLLTRQAAADDYFALLVHDRNDVYACWQYAEQRRQEAETVAACVKSERDELLEECAEWRVEAQTLQARLAPYLAAEANAHAVDVPPGIRPIDGPQDEATGPIYVKPLWDALGAGPTSAVTDPGHVPPSWAREDDTVPVPAVRDATAEGVA